MTILDQSSARLYLGRDWATAAALGPREFRSARKALRFAFEHAAPVSLHGARLLVGGRSFTGAELSELNRLRLDEVQISGDRNGQGQD
ncbi:MAG TPA: hypothetical protein VIN06_16580 [Devosia sp.]